MGPLADGGTGRVGRGRVILCRPREPSLSSQNKKIVYFVLSLAHFNIFYIGGTPVPPRNV